MAGAVGVVVMTGAGFQLGRPPDRVQIALLASHPMDVPGKLIPAKTVPNAAPRAEGLSPSQTPQEPPIEQNERSEGLVVIRDGNGESPVSERHPASFEVLEKPATRERPVHPLSLKPTWPLALKQVDFEALGVPPPQQAAIQKLQEQFVKEVGGPNQNPADPAYGKAWLMATQRADDLLRAQIGWDAFNAYSIATKGVTEAPQ
ncbi:MAG: hypothetical protein B7Z37_04865 [Verrucomicrobia bacterium 12-59-8]|nr:MAG: hypothetical protein B7Z37_04865 [Verrucomicrobia bacterium 12-59-8]